MMKIRIDLGEGSSLQRLMPDLAAFVGRSSVWLEDNCRDICVRSNWAAGDSNRLSAAIESWLAADGDGSSAGLPS